MPRLCSVLRDATSSVCVMPAWWEPDGEPGGLPATWFWEQKQDETPSSQGLSFFLCKTRGLKRLTSDSGFLQLERWQIPKRDVFPDSWISSDFQTAGETEQ